MNTRKSLKQWCEENGEYGKGLASEYVGTTERGGHYDMTEITYGSKKKVLWRCSKDTSSLRLWEIERPIIQGVYNAR